STDGTDSFLKRAKKEISNLSYFRQKKKGPATARNLGIKNSTGDIIFFTDDDCIVPKNWIEKFVHMYQKHPEIVGVGGYLEADEYTLKTNIFAKYESYMARTAYRTDRGEYIGGFECPALGTSNISYKKSVLEEVGGFDEIFSVAVGEDTDLKLNICLRNGKLAYIPLKTTHIQDYKLGRFIRQNVARGISDVYFLKKWRKVLNNKIKKKQYSAVTIFLKMLKELKFSMLFLFLLSVIARRWGKWKQN
ncbi:unnamed protein product, partial [marine sediment metagenome]